MASRAVTLVDDAFTQLNVSGASSVSVFLPEPTSRLGGKDRVAVVIASSLPAPADTRLSVHLQSPEVVGVTGISLGGENAYGIWLGSENTPADERYVVVL